MALIIDWTRTTENGMRVERSETNPILESSSVLFESLSSEFEAGQEGFRKSGNVILNNSYEKGFSRGRIRTLWRRNTPSTDQSEGWGGIFIMSDILGIGTRLAPMNSGYQITDKGGTLKVLKFRLSVPFVLHDTGISFPLDTVRGLDVTWRYESEVGRTVLYIKQGSSLDFVDLTTIATVSDFGDSVTGDPVQFSTSEGLFSETLTHDSIASYSFEHTYIYKLTTL